MTTAYHAEGIIALEQALSDLGDVFVVAPASEQSGASHSLTLSQAAADKADRRPSLGRGRHADRLRHACAESDLERSASARTSAFRASIMVPISATTRHTPEPSPARWRRRSWVFRVSHLALRRKSSIDFTESMKIARQIDRTSDRRRPACSDAVECKYSRGRA